MKELPSVETPWGRYTFTREIVPGVFRVATASHGGFWVRPDRLAEMPDALRCGVPGEMPWSVDDAARGWFEEDEEATRVVLHFAAGPDVDAFRLVGGRDYDRALQWAKDNWPATVEALRLAGHFDRFKPKAAPLPPIKLGGMK